MKAMTVSDNPIATENDVAANRILLVRHGGTYANAGGYFLGKVDADVNERGRQQSARAVEGICAWHPDRVVSSPLRRCFQEIAVPVSEELGVSLEADQRIREFDFGPLEGKTYVQVVGEQLPFPWGPGSEDWPPSEGGESMEYFLGRVGEVASELEALQGRTAVICHGGIIRAFMAHWLDLEIDTLNKLEVANVSSVVFKVSQGHVQLEKFGLTPEQLALQ